MASKQLTPQQELFALEYVRCGVGATAYRASYKVGEKTKQATVYAEVTKLFANPLIAQRIRELYEKAADVTIGELVSGYRQARDISLEDRNGSAATGAITGLARVKGFLKDDPTKAGDIHLHIEARMAGLG